uniref:Gamma-glutamyl phosphate reductase n=1 Tax=Anthurium amnicola TaxID=1678845 RepID=A0A1D1Y6V3_9ARAE
MDQKKVGGNLVTCGGPGGSRHGQTMLSPAFNFVVQLPQKLQSHLKSHFKQEVNNGGAGSTSASMIERETDYACALNLEKQLQAWKENPNWDNQPPEVKVSVPKGSLCNLNVKFKVGLPPDAIYNIVIDPNNRRVFKNIKEVISRKVLVDEGSRQVVELEQAALWRFLWWSGTISVHVFVDQNRKNHTVKFKQGKLGFMKRFEGCWRVEPIFVDERSCSPLQPRTLAEYESCTRGKGRVASLVTLDQLVQPSIVPPPPISWYLRGITTRTTEMLIHDLLAEADRLRGTVDGLSSVEHESNCSKIIELPANDLGEIKERWRQMRRVRRRQV